MKRVVADSNVLVSALQFGGKPMALLTLAEDGRPLLFWLPITSVIVGAPASDMTSQEELLELGLDYVAGILPNTSVWPPGTAPLPPKPWSGRGR